MNPPTTRPMRRRLLLAGLAAGLSGCGFHLRRPPTLAFERIALKGFGLRSPFGEELQRAIEAGGRAQVVAAGGDFTLESLADTSQRVVTVSTAAGQVTELTLTRLFRFRVVDAHGAVVIAPTELSLTRDVSYAETDALAKRQEIDMLFGAMQTDLVHQVVRRLAPLKPGAPGVAASAAVGTGPAASGPPVPAGVPAASAAAAAP